MNDLFKQEVVVALVLQEARDEQQDIRLTIGQLCAQTKCSIHKKKNNKYSSSRDSLVSLPSFSPLLPSASSIMNEALVGCLCFSTVSTPSDSNLEEKADCGWDEGGKRAREVNIPTWRP